MADRKRAGNQNFLAKLMDSDGMTWTSARECERDTLYVMCRQALVSLPEPLANGITIGWRFSREQLYDLEKVYKEQLALIAIQLFSPGHYFIMKSGAVVVPWPDLK